MRKIFLFALASFIFGHAYAKNIQVEELVDLNSLNCSASERIFQFANDLRVQKKQGLQVDLSKQNLKLASNIYWGVQAHQNYQTKNMVQDDFAVNFEKYGLSVIKIAFQAIKTSESESGAYYFIFKGKPSTVLFQLKKTLGNKWNIENILEETPQGNSKYTCVYIG